MNQAPLQNMDFTPVLKHPRLALSFMAGWHEHKKIEQNGVLLCMAMSSTMIMGLRGHVNPLDKGHI